MTNYSPYPSVDDRCNDLPPRAFVVLSQELMQVVRSDTVPLTVRSAFARLVESCHLDVAPLLPQPPVRYSAIVPTGI